MTSNYLFALAIGIGIVAGLRAMTAPLVVSWAAHLGWIELQGSPLSFMGSKVAVIIFTLAAIAEYVNDKLPKTPARTAPPAFIARIVMGALSAACLYAAASQSLVVGALFGAVGAVIGTLGGYQARKNLVKALNIKDIFVAIPEDLVAIALGYFIVR
jgi:Predicted membrane protein